MTEQAVIHYVTHQVLAAVLATIVIKAISRRFDALEKKDPDKFNTVLAGIGTIVWFISWVYMIFTVGKAIYLWWML